MEDGGDKLIELFEELAEMNLVLSLKLMIVLYDSGIDLSHENSNSIEIWIFENSNDDIVEFIKSTGGSSENRLLRIANQGIQHNKSK